MKRIITIIFAIALATNISAQVNKYEIGIISYSPNISFLRGNELVEKNMYSAIGSNFGLSFKCNFRKTLSVKSGVLYDRKVATTYPILNPPKEVEAFSAHYKFEYLNVPILLQINFDTKIYFFANAGFYLAYLLKETTFSNGGAAGPQEHINTEMYKKYDTGISTGLGIAIPIGEKLELTLEARNNLGLLNISAVPVYNDGSIKTNSTNLLIGLAYKFGKK
jgi:hypothetical protein